MAAIKGLILENEELKKLAEKQQAQSEKQQKQIELLMEKMNK